MNQLGQAHRESSSPNAVTQTAKPMPSVPQLHSLHQWGIKSISLELDIFSNIEHLNNYIKKMSSS